MILFLQEEDAEGSLSAVGGNDAGALVDNDLLKIILLFQMIDSGVNVFILDKYVGHTGKLGVIGAIHALKTVVNVFEVDIWEFSAVLLANAHGAAIHINEGFQAEQVGTQCLQRAATAAMVQELQGGNHERGVEFRNHLLNGITDLSAGGAVFRHFDSLVERDGSGLGQCQRVEYMDLILCPHVFHSNAGVVIGGGDTGAHGHVDDLLALVKIFLEELLVLADRYGRGTRENFLLFIGVIDELLCDFAVIVLVVSKMDMERDGADLEFLLKIRSYVRRCFSCELDVVSHNKFPLKC